MTDYLKEAEEHSKQFQIDITKLGDEIESQAATYNYFGTLYTKAKEEESRLKLRVKEVRGGVWLAIKNEMANAKPKPTVDDMKAMVDIDQSVLKAEKELREAAAVVQQLDNDRQSSWLKGDMLKLMSFEAARHYKSDF